MVAIKLPAGAAVEAAGVLPNPANRGVEGVVLGVVVAPKREDPVDGVLPIKKCQLGKGNNNNKIGKYFVIVERESTEEA